MPTTSENNQLTPPNHSHIFLDESGDLGWKFNAPYRNGGSSRFLTIAYLITPITHREIPRRIVREFYKKFGFNIRIEIKGSDLKPHHREFICTETIKMLKKYENFRLGAVTVEKINIDENIKKDSNLLYHYLIGKAILDKVCDHSSCKLTRDNRNVKTVSQKSCIDYLQTYMFFHLKKMTLITDNPTHSHTELGVIFIDWITNMVWTKYEDGYSKWCDILSEHITETIELF